jgi:hypothetical protein
LEQVRDYNLLGAARGDAGSEGSIPVGRVEIDLL